jgi:hypothetical protein
MHCAIIFLDGAVISCRAPQLGRRHEICLNPSQPIQQFGNPMLLLLEISLSKGNDYYINKPYVQACNPRESLDIDLTVDKNLTFKLSHH